MASLQSNSTFSFKHHLTGKAWPAYRAILPFHSNTTRQTRHGQLAEQFYLFIQTPLNRRGMASLQSNTTSAFSFKHHLTGEAWSTIAKNRHLNRFAIASGTISKNQHLRLPEKHPGDRLCIRPARLCPNCRRACPGDALASVL